MNKYFIKNGNQTEEISLSPDVFCINGKEFKYEKKFVNDNILILRLDNKNYIVKADKVHDEEIKNTEFEISVQSKTFTLECKSELDVLVEKLSKSHTGVKIKNELTSPMPGSIVKINVREGQKVKKGDVLLVLEAMKMENELKAAGDVIVKQILVEEKMSVDKNQVLVKFEL